MILKCFIAYESQYRFESLRLLMNWAETNVQGMMYELACTDYARIFALSSVCSCRIEKSARIRRFTYI